MDPRNRNEDAPVGSVSQRGRSAGHDTVTWDVVSRVAAAEGVDPVELPPLGDAVDPEALEQVVQNPTTVDRVSFEYCGRQVAVEADGATTRVEIEDDR